jgi:hypothetical protein
MNRIYHWFEDYGGDIRIPSDFGLNETVSILKREIRGNMPRIGISFSASQRMKPELVGQIKKEKFVLAKAKILQSNPNRIFFVGEVKEDNGSVYLEGRFESGTWTKIGFWISLFPFSILVFLVVSSFIYDQPLWRKVFDILIIPLIYFISFYILKFTHNNNDREWIHQTLTALLENRKV